jgi:signal transduction histidine kinase
MGQHVLERLPVAQHRPDEAALDIEAQRGRAMQRLAALGEMTGGIAHDFRNFLAVIDSGLRLAETNAADPEAVASYLAASRDAVGRAVALTSQLLAFARHQELEPHAGNVNEFLREFEPFLRYGAGFSVRLVVTMSPEIPRCLIDPTLFDAAVLNLVVNARDAMPNGGEIHISTQHVPDTERPGALGGFVQVRVADQGVGMTPETLRNIFNPFFSTKGETGTGLGLPQVHAFMELVGGKVAIASDPGAGTTCDLLFPALP